MRRLRDESGLTLVELLISMTVMSVVLAATLTVVEVVQRQNAEAVVRVDSRDRARTVLDRMIKRLRAPVELPGGMVERADPFEVVYQIVGATAPAGGAANTTGLQRVRICLDTATGRINRYRRSFTALPAPALPAPAACADATGYDTSEVLGTDISNGAARPLFAYEYRTGSTALNDLTGIQLSLYVDTNGARRPAEVHLTSTVTLRNVNQPPVASFTDATVNGHVLGNASPSTDPEGGSLSYEWYLDGGATPVGTDVRLDQGGLLNGSTHTFKLKVTDTGGLTNEITRSITLP